MFANNFMKIPQEGSENKSLRIHENMKKEPEIPWHTHGYSKKKTKNKKNFDNTKY